MPSVSSFIFWVVALFSISDCIAFAPLQALHSTHSLTVTFTSLPKTEDMLDVTAKILGIMGKCAPLAGLALGALSAGSFALAHIPAAVPRNSNNK